MLSFDDDDDPVREKDSWGAFFSTTVRSDYPMTEFSIRDLRAEVGYPERRLGSIYPSPVPWYELLHWLSFAKERTVMDISKVLGQRLALRSR